MKNIILFLLLSITTTTINAQSKLSRSIGEKSPEIAITNWIENAPQEKSLKNKFVVLEFWSTWCGPCLAAVPHVNELREAFKENDNVVFLSMTYENVEKVQRTLKRVHFKSSVVTDTNSTTHKNFSADGSGSVELPYAILIDKDQVIKWMGLPKDLTKEILNNFVNNKTIEAKEKVISVPPTITISIEQPSDKTANRNTEKIFEFKEAPSSGNEMVMPFFHKGMYKATATNLDKLFAILMDVPINLVVIPQSLKDKKYQVNYSDFQQSNPKVVKSIILDSVMARLNLKYQVTQNDVMVYALTISDISKLDIPKESSSIKIDTNDLMALMSSESDTDDGVVYTNQTLKYISLSLSKRMNTFIENQTKVEKPLDIIANTKTMEQLEKSLNSYGISLIKTQKNMEAYTFEIR